MYLLKLATAQCLCCGICLDVCRPRAIALRPHRSENLEGPTRTCRHLHAPHNAEPDPPPMLTFPYLAAPARCDGCRACIRECPAEALTLVQDVASAPQRLPAVS